ncbi:winged helix-turn-helix domain-containing protein [Pseudoalteromonas piscicida]|uniref:winged helix-turn-helix domain-containing protein n=1 Tax=Pseudoalteromonas piscicida TaxID=43662 RepID=UPI0032C09D17
MQYQLNQKWDFDVSSRTISHRDVSHVLTPLAHRLLLNLIEHAPHLVSHQQLEQQVWLGRVVTHDAIKKQIARLRKLLEDDANKPEYIVSERSFGYRFSATVNMINHEAQAPAVKRFTTLAGGSIGLILVSAICIYHSPFTSPFSSTSSDTALSIAQQHFTQQTLEDNLRAIALYQQSITTSQDVDESYKGLSRALLSDYSLYNQVADALTKSRINTEKALDLTPDSPSANLLLARVHTLQGHYHQAQQLLNDTIANTPNWPLLKSHLAETYLLQGNTIDAYPLARQAYEASPSEPKVVASYLHCLRKMHMANWFNKVLTNASPEVKGSPWIQLEHVQFLQQQTQHKKAIQHLNLLAKAAPNTQTLNWFAALSYLSNNHHDKATNVLALTVEKHGKYALFSQLYLSFLTAKHQSISRYTNDIANQIKAGNQDPELVFSLGLISLYHQQNDKARHYFKQAIQQGFSDEFRFKALPFNITADQAHFVDNIVEQLALTNLKKRIKRTPK